MGDLDELNIPYAMELAREHPAYCYIGSTDLAVVVLSAFDAPAGAKRKAWDTVSNDVFAMTNNYMTRIPRKTLHFLLFNTSHPVVDRKDREILQAEAKKRPQWENVLYQNVRLWYPDVDNYPLSWVEELSLTLDTSEPVA